MLHTCLLIQNLRDEKTALALKQKLGTMGFVTIVIVNRANGTIYFEYATFRDMDTIIRELRNMGHVLVVPKKTSSRKRHSIRGQTN